MTNETAILQKEIDRLSRRVMQLEGMFRSITETDSEDSENPFVHKRIVPGPGIVVQDTDEQATISATGSFSQLPLDIFSGDWTQEPEDEEEEPTTGSGFLVLKDGFECRVGGVEIEEGDSTLPIVTDSEGRECWMVDVVPGYTRNLYLTIFRRTVNGEDVLEYAISTTTPTGDELAVFHIGTIGDDDSVSQYFHGNVSVESGVVIQEDGITKTSGTVAFSAITQWQYDRNSHLIQIKKRKILFGADGVINIEPEDTTWTTPEGGEVVEENY